MAHIKESFEAKEGKVRHVVPVPALALSICCCKGHAVQSCVVQRTALVYSVMNELTKRSKTDTETDFKAMFPAESS